jgi:hypothetical protein
MAIEVGLAYRHLFNVFNAIPDVAISIPGGLHRSIAPTGVMYPFATMQFMAGEDILTFSGGFVGSGMDLLVKVIDKSQSEEIAQAAFETFDEAIIAANGQPIAESYVWFDRRQPFNLPVAEDDTIFAQVGRTYRVLVDR